VKSVLAVVNRVGGVENVTDEMKIDIGIRFHSLPDYAMCLVNGEEVTHLVSLKEANYE
jgi:hypothetical protein